MLSETLPLSFRDVFGAPGAHSANGEHISFLVDRDHVQARHSGVSSRLKF